VISSKTLHYAVVDQTELYRLGYVWS